jgi:hypothetical protein
MAEALNLVEHETCYRYDNKEEIHKTSWIRLISKCRTSDVCTLAVKIKRRAEMTTINLKSTCKEGVLR